MGKLINFPSGRGRYLSPYKKLASELASQHIFLNGLWQTLYKNIPGLRVTATSSSGRSGLGVYRGHKVYWYSNDGKKFIVEIG